MRRNERPPRLSKEEREQRNTAFEQVRESVEQLRKITEQFVAEAQKELAALALADNGKGLDVHEILTILKNMLAQGLLDTSSLSGATERIVQQWPQHPFAIRRLNLGQVLDLAALPRLSGSDASLLSGQDIKPSGLGLWGARLLVEKMGGRILSTNSGDPQWGAMFTIILPNHHFSSAERSGQVVNLVRRQLERGQRPMNLPYKEAA